jgi:hypothetical protein
MKLPVLSQLSGVPAALSILLLLALVPLMLLRLLTPLALLMLLTPLIPLPCDGC